MNCIHHIKISIECKINTSPVLKYYCDVKTKTIWQILSEYVVIHMVTMYLTYF